MNYVLEKNLDWREVTFNHELIEVPLQWDMTTLGTLVNISSGGTPEKNDAYYGGNIPWITTTDLNYGVVVDTVKKLTALGVEKSAAKVIPKDTILFAMYGASIGKMGMSGQPSATNQSVACLVCSKTQPMFLFYKLMKHRLELAALGSGSGQPNINQDILKKFQLIVPPLAEQTAIANILSDQEVLIAHCNGLIALHEKRFAYLSDELLSGRLRLVSDAKNTFNLMKNVNWQNHKVNGVSVDVPIDWTATKLSELVTKASRGQSPTYLDESTTVVTSQKCLGTYTFNILKARSCKPMTGERGHFLPGDVLLASTGEGTLGKCAIADIEGYCDSHVSVIRFSHVQSGYLFHTWVRKNFEYVNNQWASGGTKQTELKLKNVLAHEWINPPLEEQTAIANVLSDQEALIAQYKNLRDAEKKRFDWLSDALLSGTYRVKVEE